MTSPSPEPSPTKTPEPVSRLTDLIRFGGLAVVVNEVFVEPTIRQPALGIAAVMLLGAQALESFLSSMFGRRP
jgi:hypothetical protein